MNNTPPPPSVWTVEFSSKAAKQRTKLPSLMASTLFLLVRDLEREGPNQPKWYHYSKLAGTKDTYHCHLNKGKPRYVVVWAVLDHKVRVMEVKYAGTHENVHYSQF